MALTTCYRIAGGYRLYYASYDSDGSADFPSWSTAFYLGMTGEEGIRCNRDILLKEIVADQVGGAIIDHVHQGENMVMEFVVQDYNRQAVQSLLFPWQTSAGATSPTVDAGLFGVSGKLACGVMGTLWAFPIAGTPAAALASGGASVGTNAMQFKGIHIGPTATNMDSINPNFVPVRFQCYPFTVSDTIRLFNWVSNNVESSSPYSTGLL